MMHPDSRLGFINDEMGFGVFATKKILKGTITYVVDELESIINEDQFRAMDHQLQKKVDWFSYRDEYNRRVLSWDHAKFVNHHCHCNTMSTGWGFEIAIRDIDAGEEITDEYGLFMDSKESMVLQCGEPDCRGIVSGQDKYKYGEIWDKKIQNALMDVLFVDQPLMNLLDLSVLNNLHEYLKGQSDYRSILPREKELEATFP